MLAVIMKQGFELPGYEDTIITFNLQECPRCFTSGHDGFTADLNATANGAAEEAWDVTSRFYVSSLGSTRACFAIVYILVRFFTALYRPQECSSLRVGEGLVPQKRAPHPRPLTIRAVCTP